MHTAEHSPWKHESLCGPDSLIRPVSGNHTVDKAQYFNLSLVFNIFDLTLVLTLIVFLP